MGSPFEPKSIVDGFTTFSDGMNSGISPLLLPKTQLAYAFNGTMRGTFFKPRPPFRKIKLSFPSQTVQTAATKALFQGASYYKPDLGNESLRTAVAGRLFQLTPDDLGNAVVTEIALPAAMDATAPQAWLWQTEKWTIYQDGTNKPMFIDETTATQSNYGQVNSFNTTITTLNQIPAVGSTVTLIVGATANMVVGDVLTIANAGQFLVQSITDGTTVVLVNQSAGPVGKTMPANSAITWQHTGAQLPPGRMGAYGLGRNWFSLVDGKQFVASDLVGGSSGTLANNFRDAVLSITENTYLVGGGNFAVPGQVGDIRAMLFQSVLDKSLGQGALQVVTPNNVFTCNAPVDRTTWQSLQNPILTESLIGSGGLGQNSTIQINSDTIFRSADGIRSIQISTRDFESSWANVPISREVSRLLDQDNVELLQYGSAIFFDNRLLMTASPQAHDFGVYHQALVSLNNDPISTLRGKAPPIYDGVWAGLNVLQLVRGYFGGVDRAFAFTLDVIDNEIQLYELLPSRTTQIADTIDGNAFSIVSYFESPVLFYEQKGKSPFDYMRLEDGELFIDKLQGRVGFTVEYRPDQYSCWRPWIKFSVCAKQVNPSDASTANNQPAYQSRLGLGQPPAKDCDPYSGRPFREGYWFQVRIVMQGYCEFIGARFKGTTLPQPQYSKPICNPQCGDP